jgi:catechol 2,3-dioxygenase-like lactoylglutathione lyase family enzyme
MVGAVNTDAEQAPSVPALRRPAPIFPVRDLNFSLAFYERLGFRTDTYDEGYGFARRERLRLHLRVMPELDPLANNSGVYVDAPAVDALHSEWLGCGLRVVPADIQEADERAGRITEAVEAKPWGVREVTIVDPDNNQLRFGQETDQYPGAAALAARPG